MKCTRCNSKNIVKNGFKQLVNLQVQKYRCNNCSKYFTGEEKFHHLTDTQKLRVSALLKSGYKEHQVAEKLNVYLRAIQHFVISNKKKEED